VRYQSKVSCGIGQQRVVVLTNFKGSQGATWFKFKLMASNHAMTVDSL
jgi:hypothetical protein